MENQEDLEQDEDDLVERLTIKVDPGQGPLRIDKFLSDRVGQLSRNRIQKGITEGAVRVNDQLVKSNYKVRPLDEITIVYTRYEQDDDRVLPEPIPLDIVYEDEVVLVVNKPAGLVVHPGIGNRSGTLVNALAYHLTESDLPVLEGNPENRPGLVHRIDKNTSGLLVVAKTSDALTRLAKQFFDHTTERTYTALVWGQPKPQAGTIRFPIGRDRKDPTRYMVYEEDEGGKHAVTHYDMLEAMYYVSLVSCQLETGRTHQIRVHFKHLGHPLFGDDKYGGDRIRKGTVHQKYKQFVQNCFDLMPHQALHAASLGFTHPVTGESMHFEAPLPDYFSQVLDKWRRYVSGRKSDIVND